MLVGCFQRLKIPLKQSKFHLLVVVVFVVCELQTLEMTLHPTRDPRFRCWKPLVYNREIIMCWAMALCDSMEEPVSCILECVLRLYQQVAPSAVLSVAADSFLIHQYHLQKLCSVCSVIPQDYIILVCTIMRDLNFSVCVIYNIIAPL